MQIEKSFVAYIDILGFSDFVKTHTSEETYELLTEFINASHIVENKSLDLKHNLTIFSDSVIISAPACGDSRSMAYHKILYIISSIQIHMLAISKQLIRGGLAWGDFYTNNKNILFGNALIESYHAESRHAIFPRVAIMTDIITPEKTRNSNIKFNEVAKEMKKPELLFDYNDRKHFIARDNDGILFCNYLYALKNLGGNGWIGGAESFLHMHKNIILENLRSINQYKKTDIYKKYYWMKTYHNWFCKGFKECEKFLIET